MRVLLDTNILLDIALGRHPFVESSLAALEKVRGTGEEPFVAPHSLATFYYMLGRAHGLVRAREAVEDLLMVARVSRFDHDAAMKSCQLGMRDFEDAMVVAAALMEDVTLILTRNEGDFEASPVASMSPDTFIQGSPA